MTLPEPEKRWSGRPERFRSMKSGLRKLHFRRVPMTVTCSKGTYIRTLCYDIGRKLGCGGCMEKLLGTRVHGVRWKRRIPCLRSRKSGTRASWGMAAPPVDRLFSQYPLFQAVSEAEKRLENGNPLLCEELTEVKEPEHGLVGLFSRRKVFRDL